MVDDNMNDNINSRQCKKIFSTSETVLLVIVALLIGLSIGFLFNNNKKVIEEKYNDKNLNEFVKNYNYRLENYYEEIDKEKLINSAIAGMMESLDDPYSMYFDESETNNFSITLDGSYKGIGIQIIKDETTGYMLITAVFKDSPASKSGLVAGYMII